MKFGYFGGFLNPMQHNWYARDDGITSYRFRNGVPNRITLQAANPLSRARPIHQLQSERLADLLLRAGSVDDGHG